MRVVFFHVVSSYKLTANRIALHRSGVHGFGGDGPHPRFSIPPCLSGWPSAASW